MYLHNTIYSGFCVSKFLFQVPNHAGRGRIFSYMKLTSHLTKNCHGIRKDQIDSLISTLKQLNYISEKRDFLNLKEIERNDYLMFLDGKKKPVIRDQDEAVSPSNMLKKIEKEDMKKVAEKRIGQDAEEEVKQKLSRNKSKAKTRRSNIKPRRKEENN